MTKSSIKISQNYRVTTFRELNQHKYPNGIPCLSKSADNTYENIGLDWLVLY